jgi:tetratricopeptide (TPR) repeat protein
VYALAEARGATAGHAALRTLAERELIDLAEGDVEFTFTSEVIRDVAYGTLTKSERARRHAILADWLAERADPDDANTFERVAYHYATAARIVRELGSVSDLPVDLETRAVDAIEAAAVQARNAEMWRNAHRLYDQALTAAGPATAETRRWNLLLGRARASAEQRELGAARHDVDEVLVLADDERVLANALTLQGEIQQMEGEYTTARKTLESAIGAWADLGDLHGEAEAVRARGRVEMFAGNMAGAEADLAEALSRYRAAGDRRGEAWSLQNLATISFFQGDAAKAEERLGRAEVTFRELGDYGGLNWTFAVLAWVRFMQGRREDAEQLALQQLPESETVGNRWVTAILQMLLGNIALWSGRARTAVERSGAAVDAMQDLGDPWGTSQALAIRIRALAAAGRIAEALDLVDRQIAELDRDGDRLDSFAHTTRLQVLVAAGTSDALPAALHLAPDPGDNPSQFNFERRVCLGRSLLQAGRAAEAVAELDAVRSLVSEHDIGPGAAIRAALSLALVAAGELDRTDAEIAAGVNGSYLDALQLELAGAFLALRRGDEDAADRFDAIVTSIDDSEALLEQAVCRIARAHAFAALGNPDAPAARAEADRVLAAHDLAMPGWETTFRLAASTT